MANELPYLPFFVGDFLVAVGTWPADRVGAYALALFYQFETGGLPARDKVELARIFHVSHKTALRLWKEIGHKFHKRDDGLWWNQRLEEVRVEARAKVATASNRGKSGAAARWGKGANRAQAHAQASAQAIREQYPDDGNQIKVKEEVHPPKGSQREPAMRGRTRKPSQSEQKLAAAIRRSDPFGQRAKTAEMQRLIDGGMSPAEAQRQVFE